MTDIARNIQEIRERICRAALSSNRPAEAVTLLAITKTIPVETIDEAIAAGLSQFGENRVQEAEPKIVHFQATPDLKWHLVGHLQSNKAALAARLFDFVHSVDSIRIAEKLHQAAQEMGKVLPILLQIKLEEEETKSGAHSEEIRSIIASMAEFSALRLNGLMTIPPYSEDPEEARPYFARLRKLSELLESEQAGCLGQRHLSMGMSNDFEVAIQEGATIVRVGTALFGNRSSGWSGSPI
jgi:PLP dependent protein